MTYHKQVRSRRTRGKLIHSTARTTPKGKGRIKKRPAYKKHMKKKPKKKK